jgi:protein-tyrosine phosphatase
MATGRIDIHAHLIPGIDDGCPTLADSIECGRMFERAGYTHLTCTPHVWPELPGNTVEAIRQKTRELQESYRRAGLGLTLLPGGELNLDWYWPKLRDFERHAVVSYGLLGKVLLFDFWADVLPTSLIPAVEHFMQMGYRLVMAHPERIVAFQREPALLDDLQRRGLLIQCNSWCLMDPVGTPTRDVSERLLREGQYFLLGTDTHNARTLRERLDGIERAIEMVGRDVVRELTETNPATLFTKEMLAGNW